MRTKSQLKKQAKHTTLYKFEEGISFAEHWKLVAELSEFHLTLKRVHRMHFFQLDIRQKKRDILSEKRESGMALKRREFTPESGTVDTYALGLPRFLFPGSSIISILLPIYPSSFLRRCPYHLNLASRVFSPNHPTCAVPLMYSFLILSILVTPNENRNIFNSATSISASCLFDSATVSNPYNIAGLTATLYTFPLT